MGSFLLDYSWGVAVGSASFNSHQILKKGRKFGVIDSTGKIVVPCRYDSIRVMHTNGEFDHGFTIMGKNKKGIEIRNEKDSLINRMSLNSYYAQMLTIDSGYVQRVAYMVRLQALLQKGDTITITNIFPIMDFSGNKFYYLFKVRRSDRKVIDIIRTTESEALNKEFRASLIDQELLNRVNNVGPHLLDFKPPQPRLYSDTVWNSARSELILRQVMIPKTPTVTFPVCSTYTYKIFTDSLNQANALAVDSHIIGVSSREFEPDYNSRSSYGGWIFDFDFFEKFDTSRSFQNVIDFDTAWFFAKHYKAYPMHSSGKTDTVCLEDSHEYTIQILQFSMLSINVFTLLSSPNYDPANLTYYKNGQKISEIEYQKAMNACH